MKRIKLLSLSLILSASASMFAMNEAVSTSGKLLQGPKWEKLGSRVVNMSADHDEIVVTAHEGVFTAVKLNIRKAPIHLMNINIIFGNGSNKNVVFNKNFPAGTSTRIIDLPGNKRIIKKVNLNYKSRPSQKGRTVVSLWGRH